MISKRRGRRLAPTLGLLVLWAWVWILPLSAAAAPATGFVESCEQALPKAQIDALVESMRAVDERSPCSLERVDTQLFRTQIEWRADGQLLRARVGPKACVLEPDHRGQDLAYAVETVETVETVEGQPQSLATRCPAVLTALHTFVGEPVEALAVVTQTQPIEYSSEVDELSGAGPPLLVAGLGWIVTAGLVLALAFRARPRWREDPGSRAFAFALALLFALALAARFAVPASLANWYGPFLPTQGWGELRFGASSAVLQASVRALLPWTPDVAFGLARVTGALAVVLLMVVVRRLGGGLRATCLAGLLLALAPIAVRTSASSSEHVLAGTLALGAWATWLRTLASPRPLLPALVTAGLMLLATLARVDCWPQLLAIGLWTFAPQALRDPGPSKPAPRAPPASRRACLGASFLGAWAAVGGYAWFAVVAPSHHPSPGAADMIMTARVLITQLWTAASTPPHWLSPLTFALAGLGALASLLTRRFALVAVTLAGWALVFIPLGRNLTHDGLTGARYFLLALPLLALLAAAWVQSVEDRLRQRAPRSLDSRGLDAALAGIALLLAGLGARAGLAHEYTFQAEYRFLANALTRLHAETKAEAGADAAPSPNACTLWYVPPRQQTGEVDFDCCLDPARSPLSLISPGLRFRVVPQRGELPEDEACALYYRGSLCEIETDLAPRTQRALAQIRDQCQRADAWMGDGEAIEDAQLTSQTLNERWREAPRVELRRRLLSPTD